MDSKPMRAGAAGGPRDSVFRISNAEFRMAPESVAADAEFPEDVLPVPTEILPAAELARDADEVADDGEDFPHSL